jgi:ribosome-associated protein
LKEKYSSKGLITNIIKSIEEVKGEEVILIDMKKIDNSPCDYFIVCDGSSNTQVNAIVSKIKKNVSKLFSEKPLHIEGLENCKWVLIDYIDIVVHVFQKEIRQYYNIENLWGDAKHTKFVSNLEL